MALATNVGDTIMFLKDWYVNNPVQAGTTAVVTNITTNAKGKTLLFYTGGNRALDASLENVVYEVVYSNPNPPNIDDNVSAEFESGETTVNRYYLIDGNDYHGGTADYVFQIPYLVKWWQNATTEEKYFSVQPQGVTVTAFQTQLDPIEYSVWLVQYKQPHNHRQ